MSTVETKPKTKQLTAFAQKRLNDYNRGRGFKFLWDVYPSYWKKSWGERPRLGTVKADSEFDAVRAAYDYRLMPYNFTFEPLAIKREFKSRPKE